MQGYLVSDSGWNGTVPDFNWLGYDNILRQQAEPRFTVPVRCAVCGDLATREYRHMPACNRRSCFLRICTPPRNGSPNKGQQ